MNKFEKLKNELNEIQPVSATQFGTSIIVAPHPDDETLGCGGTIAALCKSKIPVHFIFVSDGTMSHPNSKKFPSLKLRKLRELEAKNAVRKLGGDTGQIEFLRLKDSLVPNPEDIDFAPTVKKLVAQLNQIRPESVFVPWQKDPHRDHQATWKIMHEVFNRIEQVPRILEYPVWFWERGDSADLQYIDHMAKLIVNIEDTLSMKNAALTAHVSQVTHLIDDDPEGFMLSPEVIAHFNTPIEVFFESKTQK